jgi:hypothetical protein
LLRPSQADHLYISIEQIQKSKISGAKIREEKNCRRNIPVFRTLFFPQLFNENPILLQALKPFRGLGLI